jgi:hypothetical protein
LKIDEAEAVEGILVVRVDLVCLLKLDKGKLYFPFVEIGHSHFVGKFRLFPLLRRHG